MIEGTSEAEPLGTGRAPIPPWALHRRDSGAAPGQAGESYVSYCGWMKGVRTLCRTVRCLNTYSFFTLLFFFLCQIVRQDAEVLYYVLQLSLKSAKQDFSLGVASPLKRMAGLCQYDN